MKPSGIEWIGDIPDDWEVLKYKYAGRFEKGKLPKFINRENKGSPIIGASEMNGGLPILFTEDSDIPKCRKDDVLFLWDGANAGLVSSGLDGILSSTVVKYVCTNSINIKYLFYLTKYYEKYFKSKVNGTTIPHMSYDFINDCPLLEPPLRTQQRIADYLDEKCGEIDATIAKQKESIEKLKAYKQSLISETVTKGLDKSAPLKPSGIEWIGDIPAHWEVCKIKNHCNLKTGSTPSSKDLSMFDGAENWFTPSDFTENYMLKNSLRRLNAKVFDQNLVPIFPPLSVLIVGIGATTGKVGFTTSKSSSNQQITAIIPKDKNIFPKFLLFWMIANTKMIRETALFTTLPILNNDTLGNATLLIPPYKEQLELASYIENKNIEIDVIINKKQNIIQKLDAYKKSIIFECVTGKTDL